jgi:hypothetical protein
MPLSQKHVHTLLGGQWANLTDSDKADLADALREDPGLIGNVKGYSPEQKARLSSLLVPQPKVSTPQLKKVSLLEGTPVDDTRRDLSTYNYALDPFNLGSSFEKASRSLVDLPAQWQAAAESAKVKGTTPADIKTVAAIKMVEDVAEPYLKAAGVIGLGRALAGDWKSTLKSLPGAAILGGVGSEIGSELGGMTSMPETGKELGSIIGGLGGATLGAESPKLGKPKPVEELINALRPNIETERTLHPDNRPLAENAMAHIKEAWGKEITNPNDVVKASKHTQDLIKGNIDTLIKHYDDVDVRNTGEPTSFSLDSIPQKVLSKVSPDLKKFHPEEISQLYNELVDKYTGKNLTRSELADRNSTLNAEVSRFFDAKTGDRITKFNSGSDLALKKLERDAINELFYDSVGGKGSPVGQLNTLRQGVIDIGNAAERRVGEPTLQQATTPVGKIGDFLKGFIPLTKTTAGVTELGSPMEAVRGKTASKTRSAFSAVGKPAYVDVGPMNLPPPIPGQGRLAAGGSPTPPIAGRPQPQLGGLTLTPTQLENLNAFLRSGGTSEYYTPTQLENLRRSVEIGETPREPRMADVLRAWQEWYLNPNIHTSVPGSQAEQMKAAQNPNVSLLDVLRNNRWWGPR